jgi:signal transduction histidine kinase/CheY-like chemotaxis protein
MSFAESRIQIPAAVHTSELEQEFIDEFRAAALKWAGYAAFAGGLLFLFFAAIAILGEPHTRLMQFVRLAVAVLLLGVAYCLWFGKGVSATNYVPVAAMASVAALSTAVAIPILPGDAARGVAAQATPALMFGLFLHYAFLRLPLVVSAAIGWAVCLAAIFFSPAPLLSSEVARLATYVGFANLFGMLILHLIESRERNLFYQTRAAFLAREEARHRQALAEEADRQKTRLIAAVSHDLRQPMTAAFAYLDVLRSRLSRDDLVGARAPAEKVQSALAMLGSTLDHILTAARYDSGTESLDIKLIELRPLLNDLYETYVPEAEKRGVRLRMRLPRQVPLLTTDARSIHRVLGNLISNAIKFTDPRERGGGVLVAARFRGDRCRIDVFDTGIGIAPESVADIWKPYVQLNNVERDRERGLGLGLFLVQRIVEQLPGHTIEMDSRPGRGSRYTITLPATRLDPPGHRPPPEPLPSVALDLEPLVGASVLVLEDDRDTRLSIVELLDEWRVDATAAATMAELLARHADSERLVDAIVCDYRLAGGTNGIDAIAGIRQRLGYAPHAVLVTGEPDIAPLRARAGPETTVLHKPFAPEALARPLLRAVRAARDLEG